MQGLTSNTCAETCSNFKMKNELYYTNEDTPPTLKHVRVGGAQTSEGGRADRTREVEVRRGVPHGVPSPIIQVFLKLKYVGVSRVTEGLCTRNYRNYPLCTFSAMYSRRLVIPLSIAKVAEL